MMVRDLRALESIIQGWDGEITVDAYDIFNNTGIAILSLVKNNKIAQSIKFEGEYSDLILLFTEVLRKNLHKIIKEQRDKIIEFKDS